MDLSKLKGTYTSNAIGGEVGMKAIRLRVSKWIASKGLDGILSITWEIVENAIDETLETMRLLSEGNGTDNNIDLPIDLHIYKDGSCKVRDRGRGMPVGLNKKLSPPLNTIPTIRLIFEYDTIGGKGFVSEENSGYGKGTGGTHGSGACVASATSEFFKIRNTLVDTGETYRLTYEKCERTQELENLGNIGESHGCEIHFKYDADVFNLIDSTGKTLSFPYPLGLVKARLKEYCTINKGLHIRLHYENDKGETCEEEFTYDKYKPETLLHNAGVKDVYSFEYSHDDQFTCRTWIGLSTGQPFRFLGINTLRVLRSKHEDALYMTLASKIKSLMTTKKCISPNVAFRPDYFSLPISYVSILTIDKPQFSGQKKIEFTDTSVITPLRMGYMNFFIGDGQPLFNNIFNIIYDRYKTEVDYYNKTHDEIEDTKQKIKKEMKKSLHKASDIIYPVEKNLHRCEMFLVEGNSPESSIKDILAPNQGCYGMFGYLNNLINTDLTKFMATEKYKSLYKIATVKWKALIIMTDGDPDGWLIRLINIYFLYKLHRDIIDRGRLYFIQAPLYKLECTTKSGKVMPVYIYDEESYYNFRDKPQMYIRGKMQDVTISSTLRCKGLDSLEAEDLKYLTSEKNKELVRVRVNPDTIEVGAKLMETYFTRKSKIRSEYVLTRYATPELQRLKLLWHSITKTHEVNLNLSNVVENATLKLNGSLTREEYKDLEQLILDIDN